MKTKRGALAFFAATLAATSGAFGFTWLSTRKKENEQPEGATDELQQRRKLNPTREKITRIEHANHRRSATSRAHEKWKE